MTDLTQAATAAAKGTAGRRRELPEWRLTVVDAYDIGPRMRRVTLTGEGLGAFDYEPGQALILCLPMPDGQPGWRDYTIRSFDRATRRLAIDFLLHGPTPGPDWARRAEPGDVIGAHGPRGRITVRDGVDWHLFCGDETCIPAIQHMLETMPGEAPAFVFLEVESAGDEAPIQSKTELHVVWLHRKGARPEPGGLSLTRLRAFELPPGRGHAYVIGETGNVRAQRQHLIARGMRRERISAEGYWRPGRVGGHDHVDD